MLRARVSDPSGAGAVTAWVRGERDSAFRAFPMQAAGDRGGFAVEIEVVPLGAERLSYFIEAYDEAGNGPARAGGPEHPIVLDLDDPSALAPAVRGWPSRWSALAVGALLPLVLVSSCRVLRRRRVEPELEFWHRIVAPLSDKGGAELVRHLERLSTSWFDHPTRGRIRPTRGELVDWLRRLREAEPPSLARLRQSARAEAAAALPANAATTAPVVADKVCPVHPESRGVTAVELLVVIAVLGLAAGASVLYFKPMEAPVRTAGELVEGLVKQTRARAMSTTTAHRLRPFSPERLVVERAQTCQAEAWTLLTDQELELPRGVTLEPVDWSVCFNARGTTTENILFTLEHPQFQPRRLEILLGGAVRWLD
jgi:prepilin-type N-terminal cleavage/methylation domain-containing protein